MNYDVVTTKTCRGNVAMCFVEIEDPKFVLQNDHVQRCDTGTPLFSAQTSCYLL